METFAKYKSTMNKGSKKQSNRLQNDILNLSKDEKKGLDSLIKRVRGNEIMITPTDKSGRLAVMTYNQYLDSGRSHTSKDDKIEWSDV